MMEDIIEKISQMIKNEQGPSASVEWSIELRKEDDPDDTVFRNHIYWDRHEMIETSISIVEYKNQFVIVPGYEIPWYSWAKENHDTLDSAKSEALKMWATWWSTTFKETDEIRCMKEISEIVHEYCEGVKMYELATKILNDSVKE